MVPKKDTFIVEENKEDKRKAKRIPRPAIKNQDFGKIIFPSINLAIIQKIKEIDKPTIKSNPFDISTGIFVNGKKKSGNNTITINRDQNEILSNLFDNIKII